MWDYIITFLVGAAVPTFTSWVFRKEERKKFNLERKDKYKLVAVERRLEAHQKAFYHWYKLVSIIHENDLQMRSETLEEARIYFYNNCLYLEKRTRKEFYDTINRVSSYPDNLKRWKSESHSPNEKEVHNSLINDWNAIHDLQKIIQSDVELEPINLEGEQKPEGE